MASQETLALTVNYGLAVEAAVAAGRYGHANPDITSRNFTTVRQGEESLEATLVHFDRRIGSKDALAQLNQMGLRAGELHELLAFGATYPDKQRQFPVVALGSVWQSPGGDRFVPCLGRWGGRRELGLLWFEYGCRGRCRFLAFRK